MQELRRALRRILALLRPGRAESDLKRELDAHLQLLEDRFVSEGLSRPEARLAAKRAFGGVEQAKELQRDARSFRWLAGWPMDLKLGVRMLVKSPGLTVIAVVALSVAIGIGAAYFEFVNDFFRPSLTFAGGNRLVGIVTFDAAANTVEPRVAPEFVRWRGRLRTIEELGALRAVDQNLITDDGRAEPVRGAAVSASAFRLIPTTPLLGRPLTAADELPGAPAVVVIGEEVWQVRFNRDAAVIGRTVHVGATAHTVVGVMPASFGFPWHHTLWTPLRLDVTGLGRGEGPPIRTFGRLAPGANLAAAQAEIEAVAAAATDASQARHLRPQVRLFVESLWATPGMSLQVKVLYAVNALFIALLGICGVNVATLVFARTATRAGEITVRTALGASRSRIVSQLIAEAFVLTTLAASVGLAGSVLALRWVRVIWDAAQGEPMPFWWTERLGPETLLYAVVLVVLAAVLIGGVPALKATGPAMQGRLKQGGALGSTMRFGRLWTSVVVLQVAFTVGFLLCVVSIAWGAIVARRQFFDVTVARPEYLTAQITMDTATPPERVAAVLQDLQIRISRDALVAGVSYATRLPGLGQDEFWLDFAEPAVAADAKRADDVLWVKSARVGAGYFEMFDQPLTAGRSFTQSEIGSGRSVAIVDESFVRLVLGGRTAIGQMVREPAKQAGGQPGPWFEIVGVVRDLSTRSDKKTEDAMLYRPLGPMGGPGFPRIIVHARGDAAPLGNPLRLAAAAADPELRLYDVLTLDRAAETESMMMGFFVKATGTVGAVALLLATAGIYALVSFTLARRTREIGIRTALGAAPQRIVTGILGRTLVQIGAGILLGALPGFAVVAYGTGDISERTSPLTGIVATSAVAGLVATIAIVSCLPPLRRALRISPTEALRTEG